MLKSNLKHVNKTKITIITIDRRRLCATSMAIASGHNFIRILNGINIIGTVIVFSFKQITFLHEWHAVVCFGLRSIRRKKWIWFTINTAIKWYTMMSHALQFRAIKFLCDFFYSFRWQFIGHCWRWNGCVRSLCTQMTNLIVINFFREFYFLTHKRFVIQCDLSSVVVPHHI